MKTYNKILSALVLAGSLTLTACDESFLEVSPNDRVTLDNFFPVGKRPSCCHCRLVQQSVVRF